MLTSSGDKHLVSSSTSPDSGQGVNSGMTPPSGPFTPYTNSSNLIGNNPIAVRGGLSHHLSNSSSVQQRLGGLHRHGNSGSQNRPIGGGGGTVRSPPTAPGLPPPDYASNNASLQQQPVTPQPFTLERGHPQHVDHAVALTSFITVQPPASSFTPVAAATTTTTTSVTMNQPRTAASVANTPILRIVWQRLSVLVTLLLFQSVSQMVLQVYEDMIAANVVIPLFLTMLIGAGGNAGNQAAVHAISGLVSGEYKARHWKVLLKREITVGLWSSSCLFVICLVRVYWYYVQEDVQPTPVVATVFAISFSLFLIVLLSVVLGSCLPFILLYWRVNVEHAAPVIQVLMDILGVAITCVTCSMFFPRATATTNSGGGAAK